METLIAEHTALTDKRIGSLSSLHSVTGTRRSRPCRFHRLSSVLFLLAAGLLFALLACRKPKPVGPPPPPKPRLTSALGDTFNILLTGRDARIVGDPSQDGKRRNKRENDYHSDVIIIAHVNLTLPRVTLFNIPRDMLVDIPGYCHPEDRLDFTNMDKITHASAYGQEPLLIKTIEKALGIRIRRRMALDFDSFRLMFTLLKPFLGKLTFGNRELNTPDSALMFVRDRHHYANDDLDRSRHSVLFVKTMVQRLWKKTDSRFMGWLLPQVFNLLGADTDLSGDDIRYILTILRTRRFNPDSIETAVMIGNEGPVTLWKYGQTLSCCLPVYDENAKQVAYYLKDQRDVPAFSFMEQEQKIRWPGYVFEDYDFMVSDTVQVDTLSPVYRQLQIEKARAESLKLKGTSAQSGLPEGTTGRDSGAGIRPPGTKTGTLTPRDSPATAPGQPSAKPDSSGVRVGKTPVVKGPKPDAPKPTLPKPKGK